MVSELGILASGGSAQILVQNGGYILYMITATEVNTEYRKHDIAVTPDSHSSHRP